MSPRLLANVLRLGKVGAISWAISLVLWCLLVVWIYPSISSADLGFDMSEYLKAMPKELRAVMGMGADAEELMFSGGRFTFAGYLNVEYFSWVPIMLGVYSVVYCGGLVSKEAESGTLDTLLSQPLGRSGFLLPKFFGFGTLIFGILLVSFLTLAVGAASIGESLDLVRLGVAHSVTFLIMLVISGYSTLASCVFLDSGRAQAVAGLVTALSYFANVLGQGVSALGWVKHLSIFFYFDSLELLVEGVVNWTGIGIYIGLLIVTLIGAVVVFRTKDVVS